LLKMTRHKPLLTMLKPPDTTSRGIILALAFGHSESRKYELFVNKFIFFCPVTSHHIFITPCMIYFNLFSKLANETIAN